MPRLAAARRRSRCADWTRCLRPPRLAAAALLVLLALLAVTVLGGCADEGLKPGQIKLVVWGHTLGEESSGLLAKVHAFEKTHPNIKVSLLSMGAGTMNPQKLMTAVVGNVPPDLVYQDRFTVGDWASRDTFLPLDDYIRRDQSDRYAVREQDYYHACWAEAVYKGHVYAVPVGTDDRALYYNRALFREVGLDPDKPPRTWEELRAYTKRLTQYNADGSYKHVGFIPNFGNSWLYMFAWQNGGEFMSADGRTCTMNAKPNVEALEYMVSMYDMIGGAAKLNSYTSGLANEMDPFLTGRVAMKVDGNWTLNNIARYGPDTDFAVAPAPVPAERLAETLGGKPGRFHGMEPYITWLGGFCYAIPRGSAHPHEAWEFIKWMCSPDAALIESAAQKAYNRSKGRPYVPNLSANMRVNEAVFRDFAPAIPKYRNGLKTFMDLLPSAKFRPVTFVGQRLWDEHARALDLAVNHATSGMSAQAAMDAGTRVVQQELNRAFNRTRFPLLNESIPIAIAVLCGLALLGYAVWRGVRIARMGPLSRGEAVAGYLFASPWIFGFLVLTAGPLITSIFLGFCDYDVLHAPRWVGMHNYTDLFTLDSFYLTKSLWNAFYLAAVGIPLGIVTGLAVAMLLNANVWGMSGYRTAFYVPSIVPVVASSVLWLWILNGDPDRGIINALWRVTLQPWFHVAPPGWLNSPEWAKPGVILQGLWGAGSGMILWLAGLQGIPPHLYEAAEIDGASAWSKFRNVTLPMLSPYIFFQFIMQTIAAIQVFDNVYVLSGQNAGTSTAGPVDSLLVPVLYLFNNAFKYFKMGYASALAWVLFVIILALTAVQLKLAPRWVHYEAEKK